MAAYAWASVYLAALSAEMAYAKHIVGPELGFGHAIAGGRHDDALFLKVAWGGTALATDWRPSGVTLLVLRPELGRADQTADGNNKNEKDSSIATKSTSPGNDRIDSRRGRTRMNNFQKYCYRIFLVPHI